MRFLCIASLYRTEHRLNSKFPARTWTLQLPFLMSCGPSFVVLVLRVELRVVGGCWHRGLVFGFLSYELQSSNNLEIIYREVWRDIHM